MAGLTARFRPGERVAYITQHDAYLGVITDVMFYIDHYRYAVAWDDLFPDEEMRAEQFLRRVH